MIIHKIKVDLAGIFERAIPAFTPKLNIGWKKTDLIFCQQVETSPMMWRLGDPDEPGIWCEFRNDGT